MLICTQNLYSSSKGLCSKLILKKMSAGGRHTFYSLFVKYVSYIKTVMHHHLMNSPKKIVFSITEPALFSIRCDSSQMLVWGKQPFQTTFLRLYQVSLTGWCVWMHCYVYFSYCFKDFWGTHTGTHTPFCCKFAEWESERKGSCFDPIFSCTFGPLWSPMSLQIQWKEICLQLAALCFRHLLWHAFTSSENWLQ